MNLKTLATCLLISRCCAFGVDITIGDTQLSIPAPEGYASITPEMRPYADAVKRFVPPSNEQFALFLTEEDAAKAARGEIPRPKRWFYVRTAKDFIRAFISSDEFGDLKQTIQEQNAQILKKLETEMPDVLQKINQGITKDYNVDLNLSVGETVPLPAHHESERAVAFSMIVKILGNDENGRPAAFDGVVTSTFVHLKGKVLFLYANADKADLEWTKSESQKWAEAVIAANPSTGEIAERERRSGGGIFSKVSRGAIIGAIVGGLVGVIGYLVRKKTPLKRQGR